MTPLLSRLAALLRDRQATYGRCTEQHTTTAAFWNVYLEARQRRYGGWKPLTSVDVPQMDILEKISRSVCGHPKLDTPMDVMGYGHNWHDCLARELEQGSA